MSNVKVIDAPCGAGKTSWAIQEMKNSPEKNYIYCTPTLDEVTRVRTECGKKWLKEPSFIESDTKINDFNRLLSDNENIAVTHSTFLNATTETLELIRRYEYTIIIDETLDVTKEFNNLKEVLNDQRQGIVEKDIKRLINDRYIRIRNDKRVEWINASTDEWKYSVLCNFALLDRLVCIDEKLLYVVFPNRLFDYAAEVYVLTYLFDGCLLKNYFDFFNIDYTIHSVSRNDNAYIITEYNPIYDTRFRQRCKERIVLYDIPNISKKEKYYKNDLSVSWFVRQSNGKKRADGENNVNKLTDLQKRMASFIRLMRKKYRACAADVMWTTYSDFEKKLEGRNYTQKRQLEKDELKDLSDKEKNKRLEQLKCFVSCNARGTNDFQDRWVLMYCVNMYYNPEIMKVFNGRNTERIALGKQPVKLNEKLFALSSMIQWLLRSNLRVADSNKKVYVFIPSERMKGLLIDWMDCKDITLTDALIQP